MNEFFKGLLPYLPTIVAVFTILIGFGEWKRQFVGTNRITLLEDVLASFYNARDAIAEIRSPIIYKGEGSSMTVTANSSTEQKSSIDRFNTIYERYSRHRELFNHLQAQKYRFMATFGAEKKEPFDRLTTLINDLFGENDKLNNPDYGMNSRKPPIDADTQCSMVESRRKLYASDPKEDDIAKEVDSIIDQVEKIINDEMKRVI